MSFRPITMRLALFTDERNERDVRRSRKAMLWLLEALVQINMHYIRVHRPPPLYETDVVYRPERFAENWQDIPNVLSNGFGDCEDLATWRVAELRCAGINARPWLVWRDKPRPTNARRGARFHAVVMLPGGRIEDPSLALGMDNHPITRRPVYVPPGTY